MISIRLHLMEKAVGALCSRSPRLEGDLTRIFGRPTLQELSQTAPLVSDAGSLLQLVLTSFDPVAFGQACGEFTEVETKLEARQTQVVLRYPQNFPVQRETARALYALVRQVRPIVMIETGVADGFSTSVILMAMRANGQGQLHSFDLSENAGAMVDDRERWTFHVLRTKHPLRQLRQEVLRLGPVDVFFHDSDHRFLSQSEEYELAFASLRPGGYLVSDDVDLSYAYREMVMRRQHPTAVLLDSVKCSAAMRFS